MADARPAPAAPEPLFLRACRGEPTERTPVWLMRQAGRYMAEYRAVRARTDFWGLCKSPELCCEVTLQPIEAFGLDAAIIFSDLLIPLPPLGAPVRFGAGHGPIIEHGVRTVADVDRLCAQPVDVRESLGYVAEAIRLTRAALPADVPLIGFGGAPFTLASYLVEGGSSRSFFETKKFLYAQPEAAHRLFEKLTDVVIDLLDLQIEAGCEAIQIFDSWAGALDPADYTRWGLPYTTRMVERLSRPRPDGGPSGGRRVPIIVFAKGTGTYLDLVARTGATGLGVDWMLPLDRARRLVGPVEAGGPSLQGNLDPARLLGPWEALRPAIDAVLDAAGDGRGHIFNLGHGIDQHTDPANVARLVDHVRATSPGRRREGCGR